MPGATSKGNPQVIPAGFALLDKKWAALLDDTDDVWSNPSRLQNPAL